MAWIRCIAVGQTEEAGKIRIVTNTAGPSISLARSRPNTRPNIAEGYASLIAGFRFPLGGCVDEVRFFWRTRGQMTRWMRQLGGLSWTSLQFLVAAAGSLLVLEGASRLVHFGTRPVLPFVTDAGLAPRLPPLFRSDVKSSSGGKFEVCTDSQGMRQAACDSSDGPLHILAAGDSQALGWGFPFSQTFAARVAFELYGSTSHARILAAGGADVESLRPWALTITRRSADSRTHVNLIAVNLGNDLDELYFGRAAGRVHYLKQTFEWLTTNSYFMLDFIRAKAYVLGDDRRVPPGANPVVFALDDDERTELGRATAQATLKLAKALPPTGRTIVLLIPADYQVDSNQFDKYRGFYASSAQFDSWRLRSIEAARRLDRIEETVSSAVTRKGLEVVSVKALLVGQAHQDLFDGRSHQLTAKGHELMAQAVLNVLKGTSPKTGDQAGSAPDARP